MGARDLPDDREPEAGAPARTVPGLVQPHETLEDPGPLGLGDARPVVVHREGDVPVLRGEREHDARTRVVRGVVPEVADQPLEIVGVAANPARADRARLDRERAAVPKPPRLAQHDVVQVDLVVLETKGALVETREQQQIFDDRLEPDAL